MIIFAAMLVPFVTVLALWLWFKHHTKWWEFGIPFLSSFVIAITMHATTSYFQVSRNEYWGGWIKAVSYFESWNELVHYTTTTTDSKGLTHIHHHTRIDNHSPYYRAYGSNGEEFSIDKEDYVSFRNKWQNESFQDMHRKYYSKDGDRYNVFFNNNDATLEPIGSVHSYENRVVGSRSVFNLRKVSKDEIAKFGIYKYPKLNGWYLPSVLSPQDVPGYYSALRNLDVFNAKNGASREIRIWLLVFKDQPLESGYIQQNYWVNGNMNELVLCVGVDQNNKVTWGHVFSWCDNSEINVNNRNFISNQIGKTVDLNSIVENVKVTVPKMWKRKDFEKDFSYLDVKPPVWAIVLTFLLTVGVNIGVSYWVITNEHTDDLSLNRNRYRYSRYSRFY